jgi:MFS family permease
MRRVFLRDWSIGDPIFFGWWIVVAACAVDFLTAAVFTQAYGSYVVVLRSEFGWSATLLSLGFSLIRVEHGLLGPIQGWLVDRYGPRRVVSAGLVALAIGLVLLSQVTSTERFFLAVIVMAVGGGLAGITSLNVPLIHWFDRQRATALALASIGGFGGALLLPLIVFGFSQLGWRATAVMSAVAIVAIALPAAQVLRHKPETYGVVPDGATREPTEADETWAPAMSFTARQALRLRQFYYLSVGHGCAVLVVNAVVVHTIPHLTSSLGLGLAQASGFAAVVALLTVTGTVIGGLAGDRLNRRNVVVTCMGGHALGILLLAFASSIWMVYGFALLHGLSWGIRGPLMSALRADYFGRHSFGMITGLSSLIVTIGALSGPLIAGVSYDVTGSYRIGFSVVAAFAALGAAFFVLAARAAAASRARAAATKVA